jgi:hypothetical protein
MSWRFGFEMHVSCIEKCLPALLFVPLQSYFAQMPLMVISPVERTSTKISSPTCIINL